MTHPFCFIPPPLSFAIELIALSNNIFGLDLMRTNVLHRPCTRTLLKYQPEIKTIRNNSQHNMATLRSAEHKTLLMLYSVSVRIIIDLFTWVKFWGINLDKSGTSVLSVRHIGTYFFFFFEFIAGIHDFWIFLIKIFVFFF